jgi:hypothetical protein
MSFLTAGVLWTRVGHGASAITHELAARPGARRVAAADGLGDPPRTRCARRTMPSRPRVEDAAGFHGEVLEGDPGRHHCPIEMHGPVPAHDVPPHRQVQKVLRAADLTTVARRRRCVNSRTAPCRTAATGRGDLDLPAAGSYSKYPFTSMTTCTVPAAVLHLDRPRGVDRHGHDGVVGAREARDEVHDAGERRRVGPTAVHRQVAAARESPVAGMISRPLPLH